MAEITLKDVSKQIRELFNKGLRSFEHGNLDYAIDLLFSCVEKEPRFLNARKFLRAAEVRRFKKGKTNALSSALADARNLPAFLKATTLVKAGKAIQAMTAIEKMFRTDPLNPKYAKLFADAAVKADMPEAAVVTLETARDHRPDDISIITWLGSLYLNLDRPSSARECFERLCELCPNDPTVLKKLKDTMALDSMSTDGWTSAAEKGASFHEMLKDEEEAVKLEKEAKAKKSEGDLSGLINDTKKKIETEPENINYYRALANLYIQQNMFSDASRTLESAQKLSPGDPEIDRGLTQARTKELDHKIKSLRESGDEEGAKEVEGERLQFVFNDLQDRVQRYPNDLELRFDWGVMLFDNDYIDEAIQQFQLAQRNPKVRVRALYYMGLSFKAKNQYDLAMGQLDEAVSEVPVMNSLKKDILYEIGLIAELADQLDKAAECYKKIYQSDISYKDVSKKMEDLYKRK